jgi:hypothetical protein
MLRGTELINLVRPTKLFREAPPSEPPPARSFCQTMGCGTPCFASAEIQWEISHGIGGARQYFTEQYWASHCALHLSPVRHPHRSAPWGTIHSNHTQNLEKNSSAIGNPFLSLQTWDPKGDRGKQPQKQLGNVGVFRKPPPSQPGFHAWSIQVMCSLGMY